MKSKSPHIIRRVADRALEKDAQPLLSQGVRRLFLKGFGPRAMPFFDVYDLLYAYSIGHEDILPERIFSILKPTQIAISRRIPEEVEKASFEAKFSTLVGEIKKFERGSRGNSIHKRIAAQYSILIQEVGEMVGIFTTGKRIAPIWYTRFRKSSPKESRLSQLRRSDPEFYEKLISEKGKVRKIQIQIEETIKEFDLIPERKQIRGKLVQIGVDPVTGEETVFGIDGKVMAVADFIDYQKQEKEALRRMVKMRKPKFDNLSAIGPDEIKTLQDNTFVRMNRVFVKDIGSLQRYSEEEIDAFTEGNIEYVAMTDDKIKQRQVTRIYPVKKDLDGRSIIVKGRFKGMYLEEVVNLSGRMIEGSAYDYVRGRRVSLETQDAKGRIKLSVTREPYVTVDENSALMMMIPRTREYTELRAGMRAIHTQSATLVAEGNTYGTTYRFSPEDFTMVREVIGGMALSKGAVEKLEIHFKRLSKQQKAMSDEVTDLYTADRIGGFKEKFKLRRTQKESMAWCEARDWSGLLALDTGLGKTSLAVAMIQKMDRDGIAADGRFLFVCPAKLKGNLPKEIQNFIVDSKELIDKLDIMSYPRFLNASKKNPRFADQYVAIFFDEAQSVKNPNATHKSIAMTNNPRKVLLTASPMERDPEELFMLVSLANNDRMYDEDGNVLPEFTAQKRAWKNRYAEVVGGRVMGIKNDPALKSEFRQWVKSNMYFKRKTDAPDVEMTTLLSEDTSIEMDAEVEEAYRDVANQAKSVMRDMVRKYRDNIQKGLDPRVDLYRGGRLGKVFRKLQQLSNMPETVIPGASNPKIEGAVNILDEKIAEGSRSLLFTDDPTFASHTAKSLSNRFPGREHAVALSDRIEVWKNGEVTETFKAKAYRDETGKRWRRDDWAVYILSKVVSKNLNIFTLTLTKAYSKGQNLQAFSTVVHLDRDTWNSETMKQRTARSWRSGQSETVEEYTLDMVYSEPSDELDRTLDEIRGYMQEMEAELFEEVIVRSQAQALGIEYDQMDKLDASFVELNRRYMEQALSPYAENLAEI